MGYVWSQVTQAASLRLLIPAWSLFTVHSNGYILLTQTPGYSDLAFSGLLLSLLRNNLTGISLVPSPP